MATYRSDIEVQLTFVTTEQGGRRTPARSGYRPQFHYGGMDWDAVHTYPDTELVHPGQTVRAFLTFLSPEQHVGKLWPGMTFQCREGQRVIANGVVVKILELQHGSNPHQ
jgi:translation elongation factor EF-Tu-like GTPase